VWFVVRDGDELAAVTRNEPSVAGGGYVGAIGVRPPWRGRGLAKVLLQRTFFEFWRRGSRRVSLDVDAQNPTGATHLYERAGMHVEKCGLAFEKAIA
jgi:ribosomal protein S18 acetylase RimI-like enzyme